jgi:hypothetical protein
MIRDQARKAYEFCKSMYTHNIKYASNADIFILSESSLLQDNRGTYSSTRIMQAYSVSQTPTNLVHQT